MYLNREDKPMRLTLGILLRGMASPVSAEEANKLLGTDATRSDSLASPPQAGEVLDVLGRGGMGFAKAGTSGSTARKRT